MATPPVAFEREHTPLAEGVQRDEMGAAECRLTDANQAGRVAGVCKHDPRSSLA